MIVRTYNLTKAFRDKEAVSNVDMHIQKGEIYGFLGPNGAGKTTVIRLIANLVKPTYGEIEIFGKRLTEHSYDTLKRIGSIIETPIFYKKLTARENLELHCEYMGHYSRDAIDKALELVSLRGIDGKRVGEFSLGMKQRLGIARAIVTRPEFLMLDEPINGLDPIGIKEVRDLLKSLSREYGMTLLISSHILSEIEQIADTIGVINNGRLIEEVSMDSVRAHNTEYIEIIADDSRTAAMVLADTLSIANFKVMADNTLRIYDVTVPQKEITKALIQNGVGIESMIRKNSTLEDYFMRLLNGGGIHV